MLSDERFRQVYDLLDEAQTVDDEGDPLNCGGPCGAYCCSPQTTKFLLPGEESFLERSMNRLQRWPFRFSNMVYFESLASAQEPAPVCMCAHTREIRPFVCRAFPYAPVIEGRTVVGLRRNFLDYLKPCWITEPAPAWAATAVRAWQIVLDDDDSLMLYAKLATMWAWNAALDRGEEPGPVLVQLQELARADSDARWLAVTRFFSRGDPA